MSSNQEPLDPACPICGQPAFRFLEREARLSQSVRLTVRCCQRCAGKADLENMPDADTSTYTSKQLHRMALQKQSYIWAGNLDGKHIRVAWEVPNGGGERFITGTAQREANAPGGWGQVEVLLDAEYQERVRVEGPLCHLPEPGSRWGWPVESDGDGRYYINLSWGERHYRSITIIREATREEVLHA